MYLNVGVGKQLEILTKIQILLYFLLKNRGVICVQVHLAVDCNFLDLAQIN